MSDEERKKLMKEAMKESMREFLDEKYLEFGKLSVFTIFAAALCALLYFILRTNGWSVAPTSLGR